MAIETELDVNTDKGQRTREEEKEAISIFHQNFPTFQFIDTPKKKPAKVDGIIIDKKGFISAVVEVKCRNMTREQLDNEFNCEWLVTHEKVAFGAVCAEMLCVPLKGFLYLVPEKTLLIKTLYDPNSGYLASMHVEDTRTQATVNGGTANRKNAFILMSDAKAYKAKR